MTMSDSQAVSQPMTDVSAFPVDEDDTRSAAIEHSMREQGVDPYETVQAEYWGFGDTERFTFPDGKTWVEYKSLNEGERKAYQKKVTRPVRVQKQTGDALMQLSGGEDRTALLVAAITNWNLIRGGEPVPFDQKNLAAWVEQADPRLIDRIHRDIVKFNPWMTENATVEDINEEIARLEELRDGLIAQDEGKDDSTSK